MVTPEEFSLVFCVINPGVVSLCRGVTNLPDLPLLNPVNTVCGKSYCQFVGKFMFIKAT